MSDSSISAAGASGSYLPVNNIQNRPQTQAQQALQKLQEDLKAAHLQALQQKHSGGQDSDGDNDGSKPGESSDLGPNSTFSAQA